MSINSSPLTLISWPQAILHVDGDSFFAAVEQALNPAYRGKPLVTGMERGIASAISLEGKGLGIKRGMPIALIRRNYPNCIIVPGNYEAYMAFANRMFNIMRRITPLVEEYSIDEAFADVTGLRRVLNKNYEQIGRSLQQDIQKELGISVSVGISLSKTLAKLCSKFRKPHGITCVKGKYIHILLQQCPIEKVWGIGPNISAFLRKYGCKTAYDFAVKPLPFVEKYLTKKEVEIYKELRGEQMYPVDTEKKETYQSISKAKTFAPTTDKTRVFAHLVRNIEDATAKCRKYKLAARTLIIAVKTQQFRSRGMKARLSRPSNSTLEILPIAETLFEKCHIPYSNCRQTICVLTHLVPDKNIQLSLFDQHLSVEKLEHLSSSIDELNQRFGRDTVFLLAGMAARHKRRQEFKIPQWNIEV